MQTQPIQTQLFQSIGARPKPTNPFYFPPLTPEEIRTQHHAEQQIPSPKNTTKYHQNPNNNQQRTSPINYPSESDNTDRILVSTPRGLAPPNITVPHLTPQLRTPPGFAHFPHEHGFLHSPRTANLQQTDMSITQELEDNLINLEDSIGDATQVAPNTKTRTTYRESL